MTHAEIQVEEPINSDLITTKEEELRGFMRQCRSVVIALSGGVDSSVLAFLAHSELGERALAITGISASLGSVEQSEIEDFCTRFGIASRQLETAEMSNPAYIRNAPDRCFYCKDELFLKLTTQAQALGFDQVLEGTHIDDLKGHRPSLKAAEDRNVRSPYIELSIGKRIIRELARRYDLPQAERPSAPCLSSRVAYGLQVNTTRLRQVEVAEQGIEKLGFKKVRVRHHDSIARIEIDRQEFSRAFSMTPQLVDAVKAAGFTYVTLDLAGYRSGSLLEIIQDQTDER